MIPPKEKQEEVLEQFREQLEQRDLIHDGDTIGTDDATLLYALVSTGYRVVGADAIVVQTLPTCATVRPQGSDHYVGELPELAEECGGGRYR